MTEKTDTLIDHLLVVAIVVILGGILLTIGWQLIREVW